MADMTESERNDKCRERMAFAQASRVNVGDTLVTDAGFTCMGNHEHKTVHIDWKRAKKARGATSLLPFLYVDCAEGKHFLDGQLDFDGRDVLVGLYPQPAHCNASKERTSCQM